MVLEGGFWFAGSWMSATGLCTSGDSGFNWWGIHGVGLSRPPWQVEAGKVWSDLSFRLSAAFLSKKESVALLIGIHFLS